MNQTFQHFTDMMIKFPSYAPFFLILFIVAAILYRAHISSENKFCLFDLIQDKVTGKGSLEKVGMLTAMLTLTWWFVDLAADGKANVDDAIVYGGIMGLAKFGSSWLSAKYGQPVNNVTKDTPQ